MNASPIVSTFQSWESALTRSSKETKSLCRKCITYFLKS